MQRLFIVAVLAMFLAQSASAGTKPAYVTGTLVDVTINERGNYNLSVRIGDMVYEGIYIVWGWHWRRSENELNHLVVNTEISVAVDGNTMYVLTPSGRELKTQIRKRIAEKH